jgi:hypothetical protein
VTPRTPAAAALRAIADELMDARRYVRTHVDHVRSQVQLQLDRAWARNEVDAADYDRIRSNLADGLDLIVVDPLILEGHLYAAARLLQGVAARIEGEGEDV